MLNIDVNSHEPFTEFLANDSNNENKWRDSMSMSTIVIMTPTCVPLNDSFSIPSTTNKKRTTESAPSFVPQKPCATVCSHSTLVLAKAPPPRAGSVPSSTVWLHIYDLSKGLAKRHSGSLTGVHVDGLYHSALVCYGLEFFFEGGIGVAAAGRTRFGAAFEALAVGATAKPLGEFLAWLRAREASAYRLCGYHPTAHNCHHFTAAAAEFLTGSAKLVPPRLFDTVRDAAATDVGSGVAEFMAHTTRALQFVMARAQRQQAVERVRTELRVLECAQSANLNARPPVCVVFFRVDNVKKSRAALAAVIPYAELLVRRGAIREMQTVSLKTFAYTLSKGADVIPPKATVDYVQTVVGILARTPRTLWGPVLNALRVAVLHKSVLSVCVFHPVLLGLLASGARDFLGLTLDGKIALLRVLCNFSSAVQGAAALNSPRFANLWISAAGLAIADSRNSAILYTGAALALNIAHAIVLTTQPSISESFSKHNSHSKSAAWGLATVLLFYLRQWPAPHIPEAAVNLLLLALFVIVTSCPKAAVAIMVNHPIRLPFDELLKNLKGKESKNIVCLLRSLAEQQ